MRKTSTKKYISGIYCIENFIDGKKYIGQGLDVKNRINKSHKECLLLYRAIQKHGKENFKRYIVVYCEEWELSRLEIECIKIFHSHVSEGGYNLSLGGDAPMRGLKHTDETKQLMRESHPKDRRGPNHPSYGTHPSEETKRKQAEKRKGRHHTEETKEKIGKANSGANNPMFEKFGIEHPKYGIKMPNASSKYYGVYKSFRNNKYLYWHCRVDGKHVGSFKAEEDAARAYDEYIIKNNLQKPLNFPDEHKE